MIIDNFSLDLLPSASFSSHKKLPSIPAVYFAISRWGEVLYVGMAKLTLRSRWQGHNLLSELDYLGCSRIAWIEFTDAFLSGTIRQIEYFFIRKYEPFLNNPIGARSHKNQKSPKKSQQLKAA